ncbi:MAG: hypothetical protein JXB48_15935 [Candidatus Latescibacteria bacterium]|nr:hypothetical protein [Candidatus Latescibacterota bacterium]
MVSVFQKKGLIQKIYFTLVAVSLICSNPSTPTYKILTIQSEEPFQVGINGIMHEVPIQFQANQGETITISIKDTIDQQSTVSDMGVRERYIFQNWSDGTSQKTRVITLTEDTTIQINVIEQSMVQLMIEPANCNTQIAGGGWYNTGDTATVISSEVNGFDFDCWKVDGEFAGNNETLSLPIKGPSVISALYQRLFILSVPTSYDSGLKIQIDTLLYHLPFSSTFRSGSIVTLSMISPQEKDSSSFIEGDDVRSTFGLWSDFETANPRTIVIDKDIAVLPRMQIAYKVETATVPQDIASIQGAGWQDNGTVAIFTAPEVSDYLFDRWEINGALGGINHTLSLVIHEPKKVTAYYLPSAHLLLRTEPSEGLMVFVDSIGYSTPKDIERFVDRHVHISVPRSQERESNPSIAGSEEFFVFNKWNDGDTSLSRIVTMAGDTLFCALYSRRFKMVTDCRPMDVAVIPGSGWYNEGETTLVIAPQVPNNVFHCWEVNGMTSGTMDSLKVTVDNPLKITAVYRPIYNLSIGTSPASGIKISIDTTTFVSPGTWAFPAGSIVTISAISCHESDNDSQVSGIDIRYTFVRWNDMVTANPRNITVDSDMTLTALMGVNYKIETEVSCPGLPKPATTLWHEEGTVATFTAPSIPHYTFDQWEIGGAFFSSESEISLTINKPMKVIARYRPVYALSLLTYPDDGIRLYVNGKVYTSPATITLIDTATMTIQMQDRSEVDMSPFVTGIDTKYAFSGWSDGNTANPRTVVVQCDTHFTAVTGIQYKVETQTQPSGIATITGGGWVNAGIRVELTAPDVPNYMFDHWEINESGTQGDKPILHCLVDNPKRITACYRELPLEWSLMTQAASFTPRDGAGVLEFQGKLWIFGGWNDDSDSEVWYSIDGKNWTFVGDAPWIGRHCFGCIEYDGKIWVLSGDGHADVWSSTDGKNWKCKTVNPPWGRRYKPYVLTFDNKMWLMGGMVCTEDTTDPMFYAGYNDVWSSTDGINWTQVTPKAAWQPRALIHGSVVYEGKMWIIGGGLYGPPPDYYPQIYYNDVWNSADGITWNCVTKGCSWDPRQHHSIAVFNNKMWVLAGHNYHGMDLGLLNDVWYSTDGISWNELPGTPWSKRHAASVIVYKNSLWMIAGYLVNDVWKLAPSEFFP